MLVLSSKVGDTIIIDGEVYITVLQNNINGVNVAIDAPDNVSIGTFKALQHNTSRHQKLTKHHINNIETLEIKKECKQRPDSQSPSNILKINEQWVSLREGKIKINKEDKNEL